jgi:predicted DNA-binding transcriptional regulator AlpA
MDEAPEKLLSSRDAAAALGLSVRRLERHRSEGTGPAYIKLSAGRSGGVRYLRADLAQWIADRRHQSTRALDHDSASSPNVESSNE